MTDTQAHATAVSAPKPEVETIGSGDVVDALKDGWRDFSNHPTHAVFVAILYPVIGLIVVWAASNRDLIQLAFPMVAGFALVGPFFALGLYELSRRAETGAEVHWQDAVTAFQRAPLGALLTLGFVLLALFAAWLGAASALYGAVMGTAAPGGAAAFLAHVLTTAEGWTLIVAGHAVGLVFAVVALTISVVSFPLILDRGTGAMAAMQTSVRAVAHNPKPMALWGLIVAVSLAAGSLPFLFGLAVVFPVLGHATWHLYRRLVRA